MDKLTQTEKENLKRDIGSVKLSSSEKKNILRAIHAKVGVAEPVPSPFVWGRVFTRMSTRRMVTTFSILSLVFFSSGFGLVVASEDSLPSSPFLYSLKTEAIEEISSFFTPAEEKIAYAQKRIDKRLQEFKEILNSDEEVDEEDLHVIEELLLEHAEDISEDLQKEPNRKNRIKISNDVISDLEFYERASEEVENKGADEDESVEADKGTEADDTGETESIQATLRASVSEDTQTQAEEALVDVDNGEILELKIFQMHASLDEAIEEFESQATPEEYEELLQELVDESELFIEFLGDVASSTVSNTTDITKKELLSALSDVQGVLKDDTPENSKARDSIEKLAEFKKEVDIFKNYSDIKRPLSDKKEDKNEDQNEGQEGDKADMSVKTGVQIGKGTGTSTGTSTSSTSTPPKVEVKLQSNL